MLPHAALASVPVRPFRNLRPRALLTLLLALVLSISALPATAAPDVTTSTRSSMQNVDYLGPSAVSRLSLDFTVLVPSYVPSPFGGEPAIDAGGGYYSLYWMVTGGPPTFLQVTGEVGGSLPAGSPYDLNNQLSVNASVQGHEAIHDVTPTYDAVWWIADGVAYKVESLNMEGTDSLALANSLIALVAPPPAPEEPEPTEDTPEPADPAQPGEDPEPTAPTEPTDQAEATAAAESTDQTVVVGPGEPGLDTNPQPDSVAPVPGEVTDESGGVGGNVSPGGPSTDGTGSSALASDGTGGPPPPVIGTDGTGGTTDLSLTP